MILRKEYMEKLKKLKDKKLIKVVTGVRRCGKSTLFLQFQDYLRDLGVETKQIICINLEDIKNSHLLDYKVLHDYIDGMLIKDKMNYVFLDEVQQVDEFQKMADSLFIKDNVDLYITGSNAHMLSSELATLLSGRYIEINMLTFSFREYLEQLRIDKRDAWTRYFREGGFPYAAYIEDEEVRRDYLLGIYNTVVLKDVVARNNISDLFVLESIAKFLFGNIGSIVSSKKIADTLTSFGRKTTSITAERYVQGFVDAFILYKVGRYDVKGKQHLKSLEKYYLVDVSLRSLVINSKNEDIGHILENIVFLELKRRGYAISVGKFNDMEIDFVCEKGEERRYYQVAATVLDSNTFAREVKPLKAINDSYPKFVISMDTLQINEDGIKIINIMDFLLE